MLRSIGFFHLRSTDKSRPIASLKDALSKASISSDLRESLVVLPVAFNWSWGYWDEPVGSTSDADCRE